MGTRANIAVKLKEEDRSKNFYASIYYKYFSSITRTLEKCPFIVNKEVNAGGNEYAQMVCMFDGYPEVTGDELLNNFNSYKEARDFVLLGNHQTLYDHCYDYWDKMMPTFSNSPVQTEEFLYVFDCDKGEWFMAESESALKLIPLKEVLGGRQ